MADDRGRYSQHTRLRKNGLLKRMFNLWCVHYDDITQRFGLNSDDFSRLMNSDMTEEQNKFVMKLMAAYLNEKWYRHEISDYLSIHDDAMRILGVGPWIIKNRRFIYGRVFPGDYIILVHGKYGDFAARVPWWYEVAA